MGWREPEPQDIGRVVFDRKFKRTDSNLIRARKILREAYLTRHGHGNNEAEAANIYFDQAMKTRPEDAWKALLKEILKGGRPSSLLCDYGRRLLLRYHQGRGVDQ